MKSPGCRERPGLSSELVLWAPRQGGTHERARVHHSGLVVVGGERRDAFSYVLPPALARGDSLLSAYGNATLAAAWRWCDVTCTDDVESVLERIVQPGDVRNFLTSFRPAPAQPLFSTCQPLT